MYAICADLDPFRIGIEKLAIAAFKEIKETGLMYERGGRAQFSDAKKKHFMNRVA